MADKQAKLDEVNKELAKYDKTSIDADLKVAETEQENAQTAYDSAKKANEDAATALTIANGDLNAKKDALNTAQKAYDDSATDVNAKQEAVNVAQANVNSFTGSDALTNAQKELDQAKSDLVNAVIDTPASINKIMIVITRATGVIPLFFLVFSIVSFSSSLS